MQGDSGATRDAWVIGGYKILFTLGHGGMGVVYQARDLALGRIVALKVLRDDLQSREHLVSRFHREAQAIARLNHPNIAHVYTVGMQDGIPYIAMEYIDGTPLSMILHAESRLEWPRALAIAEDVARALVCAHAAQVIHRDIKPGNIILDGSGHVFVTDFGIAKVLTAETQLTTDGSLLGTPQYMAPECCQNGKASFSSDVYSLGIVLFQMITGHLPFEAPTPVELIRKIVSAPPARLRALCPDVPEDVERLVAYMIEKKPKDRPPNAEALCAAIARVRAGEPLDARGAEMISALATFRESQTTPAPRAVHSATTERRPHWERRHPCRQRWSAAQGRAGGWLRTTAAKRLGWAALFVLASAALATGVYAHRQRGPQWTDATSKETGVDQWRRPADVAKFVDEAPGVVLARVHLPHFAIGGGGSLDGGAASVVQLDGRPGTPRAGQRSLIIARPAAREARLLLAPVPALMAHPNSAVALMAYGLVSTGPAHRMGDATERVPPSRDGFAFRYSVPSAHPGQVSERLALWNAASEAPSHTIMEATAPAAVRHAITAVAVKPGGGTLALGLVNADGNGYLAECGARAGNPNQSPTPVTNAGAFIRSADYAPDGHRAAYLREAEPGRASLWITAINGTRNDGILLAEGALTLRSRAFSPDGSALIVGETRGNGRGGLRLIRADNGQTETDLGEGWMAQWRTPGDFLIVSADDYKGRCQLWASPRGDARRRVQLTFVDAGLEHAFHLSETGTWAVSALNGTSEPTLLFLDLTQMPR